MSDDAELQILRAAKTVLSDIPQSVCRGVDLNRTRAVAKPTDLPRLFLIYGEDEIIDDALTFSDNRMELVVRAVVHDHDEQVTEQLSALRAAVHGRLMANRRLNLPGLVMEVVPAGATRPDIAERDAGLPVVFRDFTYLVDYRTNVADRTVGGAGPSA